MKYFLLPFKKSFDYEGRTSRKAYWMFSFISFIIAIVTTIIDTVFGFSFFIYVYLMIFTVPGLPLGIRRLHDIDKSGWAILINMIPILGGLIFFFWMLKAGTYGENQYGPEPIEELDINNKSNNTYGNNSANMVEELKKFKELLDMGAITKEEYNIKKKDILNL